MEMSHLIILSFSLFWTVCKDGLPVVGPAFSTLVIVGLIMFLVVCLAATLFFKYLAHVSQSWHERSVENRMDRAICLYNSQEPLPEEPDHVCLQPGHMGGKNWSLTNQLFFVVGFFFFFFLGGEYFFVCIGTL